VKSPVIPVASRLLRNRALSLRPDRATRKRHGICLFGCRQKFPNSQAGLSDQRSERTTCDFRVIRNREGHGNAWLRQYNVAPMLTRDLPTQVFKRAHNLSRSKQRFGTRENLPWFARRECPPRHREPTQGNWFGKKKVRTPRDASRVAHSN
jgi:hypothetical protein